MTVRAFVRLVSVLISFYAAATLSAQDSSENGIKAAYVYNFAKFIEWPTQAFPSDNSSILFCIVYDEKNNDVAKAFQPFSKATARGRPIQIKSATAFHELPPCHLVYIATTATSDALEIAALAHQHGAISVSDVRGFADAGGMIGLLKINDRIEFEINLDNTQQSGLSISAQLLKLARTVHGVQR